MKKPRFITILSACCAILMCSVTQVSASTSTPRFIDNDSNVSGYSNNRTGFSEYMSLSSLYNGDARIQSPCNSGSYYYYNFPNVQVTANSLSVQVKAYLNHSRFNDPEANYYVCVNTDDVYYYIGKINQDIAISCWNPIQRSVPNGYKLNGRYYIDSCYVKSSGTSGCSTGADAVYVTAIY